jgi:hypothetical protein
MRGASRRTARRILQDSPGERMDIVSWAAGCLEREGSSGVPRCRGPKAWYAPSGLRVLSQTKPKARSLRLAAAWAGFGSARWACTPLALGVALRAILGISAEGRGATYLRRRFCVGRRFDALMRGMRLWWDCFGARRFGGFAAERRFGGVPRRGFASLRPDIRDRWPRLPPAARLASLGSTPLRPPASLSPSATSARRNSGANDILAKWLSGNNRDFPAAKRCRPLELEIPPLRPAHLRPPGLRSG